MDMIAMLAGIDDRRVLGPLRPVQLPVGPYRYSGNAALYGVGAFTASKGAMAFQMAPLTNYGYVVPEGRSFKKRFGRQVLMERIWADIQNINLNDRKSVFLKLVRAAFGARVISSDYFAGISGPMFYAVRDDIVKNALKFASPAEVDAKIAEGITDFNWDKKKSQKTEESFAAAIKEPSGAMLLAALQALFNGTGTKDASASTIASLKSNILGAVTVRFGVAGSHELMDKLLAGQSITSAAGTAPAASSGVSTPSAGGGYFQRQAGEAPPAVPSDKPTDKRATYFQRPTTGGGTSEAALRKAAEERAAAAAKTAAAKRAAEEKAAAEEAARAAEKKALEERTASAEAAAEAARRAAAEAAAKAAQAIADMQAQIAAAQAAAQAAQQAGGSGGAAQPAVGVTETGDIVVSDGKAAPSAPKSNMGLVVGLAAVAAIGGFWWYRTRRP